MYFNNFVDLELYSLKFSTRHWTFVRVSYINETDITMCSCYTQQTSLPGILVMPNIRKHEIKCDKQEVLYMENVNKGANSPEKKFSTGAISATVWKNSGVSKKGETFEFNSVTLQRRYKDKEGEWQSTNNLRLNDLPRASLVLRKAFEYLSLRDNDTIIEEIA